MWTDPSTGEEEHYHHKQCMDECAAAGGHVEMKHEDYEGGWSEWPECIVENCGDFEATYGAGTEWESTWCERGCMITGGTLQEACDEEHPD